MNNPEYQRPANRDEMESIVRAHEFLPSTPLYINNISYRVLAVLTATGTVLVVDDDKPEGYSEIIPRVPYLLH